MHLGLLDSPFAGHYTDKGLLPVPATSQSRDWEEIYKDRLDPGPRVVIPPKTTPAMLEFEPYSTDTGGVLDEPSFFDPLGVEAYQIAKSPGFSLATKLMSAFGPKGFGTFMALTGRDAERRAIEKNRAQYGLGDLSLLEGFRRDYQPDIEYAGLEGVDPTWSETTSPDAMTADEHAATQYGYFPSEDEGKYDIGHPDYAAPSWLEVVDRPEAEGGPYTQVPDTAMYNEEDLQKFYSGIPSAIGDLGLQTDIRSDPNWYTGEWEAGQPIGKALDMLFNTPWTGYDPQQRAYDIYTHNYARDAQRAYETGGLHPFEAPGAWTDPTTGLTRSNYTARDRDAYREMVDKRRQAEADADDRVTGEWNPVTDPIVDERWNPNTHQYETVSTADWNWDLSDKHRDIPGYTVYIDETNPDRDKLEIINQQIRDRVAAEEEKAEAAQEAEAAQVAAAQAAIESGDSASYDWSDFSSDDEGYSDF